MSAQEPETAADRAAAHFTSPEHALRAGAALGSAKKAGLNVEPILDDEGNYTAEFYLLDVPGIDRIKIVVQ
jgi:hypothetical protein